MVADCRYSASLYNTVVPLRNYSLTHSLTLSGPIHFNHLSRMTAAPVALLS